MFVLAYLGAMARNAWKARTTMMAVRAGILGILTAGVATQVIPLSASDLGRAGGWLLVGVAVWFLVEWLVLAPARWWRDREKPHGPIRFEGEIHEGNQLTIWYGPPRAMTRTGTSNPEAPQSPELSTHD